MKKELIQKIISFMLLFVALAGNIAFAVTQAEIDNMEKEQSNITDKAKEAEKELENVKEEKSETVKQVEKLASEIEQYENEIEDLDKQIEELEQSIKEAEEKIEKATQEYDKQQELLDKRLVAVYELGEASYLDVLLSSSSITEFISNFYLVEQLTSYDTQLLEKIDKQKKEIENAKQQLEDGKTKIEAAKKNQVVKRDQLNSAKKEKNKQVTKLTDQEKEIQKELDELHEANKKMESQIKAAEKKYKEQLDALNDNKNNGSSGGSNNNNNAGSGYFTRPVKSGTITATAYYSSGTFHGAVDYGVSVGTPVYAAQTGVVMLTANLTSSYGTHVVIRHANGLQTYYAHGTAGSIVVKEGQTIQQGQLIMKSGNTGKSSGPHLHFEVRKSPYSYSRNATAYGQDSRVNPLNYL